MKFFNVKWGKDSVDFQYIASLAFIVEENAIK